ncbi:MAG: hypothetical protein H7256_11695 [Bdellovibrio sp.]|nr:hypothetical protein [Bdellovibrio sp.]
MFKIFLSWSFIILSVFLMSCQAQKKFQIVQWSEGQSLKQTEALDHVQTKSVQNTKTEVGNFERNVQTFLGFEIENTFVKKSYKNMKLTELSGQILNLKYIDSKKLSDFDQKLTQDYLQVKFLQILPTIESKTKVKFLEAKPVLSVEKKNAIPYWRMDYIDQIGVPKAVYLDSKFIVAKTRRLGSQFDENQTSALLYPSGPKQSLLTDVLLSHLKPVPLANDLISVSSESPAKIESMTQALDFAVDDYRFDQVQVFYYLNRSLSWFATTFKIKNLQPLEAVVHIGYPEKTNSAFYYQGRIRVGAGDGITYDHIPKDPSIVIHESVHSVIEQVAGLPYEGAGGSLNEAFADFFTAVQLQNQNLGEVSFLKGSYKRSLDTVVLLSQANAGLYHDSLIVSGFLWQLQKEVDKNKVTQLAFLTLTKLNLVSDFKDFREKFKLAAVQSLTEDENKITLKLLEKRELL